MMEKREEYYDEHGRVLEAVACGERFVIAVPDHSCVSLDDITAHALIKQMQAWFNESWKAEGE